MNHIKHIAAQLEARGLDAVLISSEPGEFYAVGFRGEGFALILPDRCWYSTDSRYIEAAEKIKDVELICISPDKGHVAYTKEHIAETEIRRLGIEDAYMSVAQYNELRGAIPAEVKFVPASELISELRASKDEEEIACMRQAQDITDRAFREILNFIKPGVTEKEVAARLTYLQMSFGAYKNSFDPIVASGPNGSMPHAIPTDRTIQSGEFVTMDFGAVFGGYCSDMTRTVCVGRPTGEMEKVYSTVLEAQLAGIKAARAGVIGMEVHKAAADVIAKAGYGEYFGHGFGHSLGIEIHEPPYANGRFKFPIPENALISAEPGIYLPGRFGVRIEDVLIYKNGGCEDITASPKELICL
jgi:Xaa-Pro aminopeptidase